MAFASTSPRKAAPDGDLAGDYVIGCDGGHSTVRRQIGIERGGADFNELMVLALFRSRELHEKLKRFPPRSTYRVIHPDLQGYWQFFGRVDVGESWFFHSPVPAEYDAGQLRFSRSVAERRRVSLRLRLRLCRLLGSAHRGRREIPGRPRLHRRRRRAFASALRRIRPQQRSRRRRQSRLEARRETQRLGRRRAVAELQRGAPADLQGDRRGFHRGGHSKGRGISCSATAPDSDRAEFERAWKEHANAAGPRVHDLRAALRRFANRVRAAARRFQRARQPHFQSARRPSPAAAAAFVGAQRIRGARQRILPCSRSTAKIRPSRHSKRRRAPWASRSKSCATIIRTVARPTRRS